MRQKDILMGWEVGVWKEGDQSMSVRQMRACTVVMETEARGRGSRHRR